MPNNLSCKICGNAINNKIHEAREMMFGLKEKFEYLECSACFCLQLTSIPDSFEPYYPQEYYSYHNKGEEHFIRTSMLKKVKRDFKRKTLNFYLKSDSRFSFLLEKKLKSYYPWLKRGTVNKDSAILDIGCGKGELLLRMYNDGFRNLTGVDPYLAADIDYKCGVKIFRKQVEEMSGSFELVMMHHAFEHMENPLELLKTVNTLLSENGKVIIRIPVAGSYAWRKYNTNWVQLDAPRHLFIHSVQSMKILCKEANFELTDVIYDSYYLQFSGSEMYTRDIPLTSDKAIFTKEQIEQFNHWSKKLNEINDGDAACFHLTKL